MEPEAFPAEIGLREDPSGVLALADSLSSFIALLHEHEIAYANPAACELLGRPRESLIGKSLCDFVHPDDRAVLDARGDCWEHGRSAPMRVADRFLHSDGRTIWLEYSLESIRVGGRWLTLVTGQDTTERRRVEEELRRSEARFRNLCQQAPVMLMSFDPAGHIRDVSNFWLRNMGYSRDEVVGREGWDFITPDSVERLQAAIEENQRNNETVLRNLPLTGICKDGSTLELLCTSVAELDEAGESQGAICVQINLTDLQRAEEALRESEERYRALVEHAPEAIMVLDVDLGLFVDANPPAEQLFGYPREKLLTMGPLDFCTQEQADGRPSAEVIEDENRRVLAGETPVFEFTHVNADGHEIQCQTRLSRLPAVGRRLIRVTTTDITELKQLQERMRHADRLAAAGAMAAGVAHEIGNPLMALSMAAQSLERRACDGYTQMKLGLISEHIERISRIVRQMSELAHPQGGRRQRCDLNEVVRRAVDMVRHDRRSESATIRYELEDSLPAVDAVEDQIAQVCINLALNAFDAMAANPPGRPRELTIRSRSDASHVHVLFDDTGPGVPAELRGRLFQPFFTTKEAGKGSGLGLSVSYRILEEHRGTLRVAEGEGPGASFIFELRRSDAT